MTNTAHNFEMWKQSLEDKMAAVGKDMEEEKTSKAAAKEARAVADPH